MIPRRSKYGAVRTMVDGVTFASKKEARRYQELRLLERAKRISHLTLQPRYPLIAMRGTSFKKTIGAYVGDFAYYDEDAQVWVTEDVKGVKTPLYRWKKRHVEAQYGIEIREV